MIDDEKLTETSTNAEYGDSNVTPPEFMEWVRQWLTDPKRKRFTWVEIIMIILTAAIAAFAGWSAWIFEGQLQEMQKASVDTKRSSDEQLRNIKDQFRLDQRPYVWISSPSLAVPTTISFGVVQAMKGGPKQILISVHYTNFGKSPAVQLVTQHDMAVGHNAMSKIKLKPILPQESGSLLPTGKDDFFSVFSRPLKDEEIIPQNNAPTPPLLRDHAVAFRVRFQYLDSLGYKYQTDICMTRLQSGAFEWCSRGNAIKDCSKEQCE